MAKQNKGKMAGNKVADMLNLLSNDMVGAAQSEQPTQQEIISAVSSGHIEIGAFRFTATGLDIQGNITKEDWNKVGTLLAMLDNSMQWLIGDFIACGESKKFGTQKEIADLFGFEYGTVRVYASVARNIDLLIRINKLSFGHHQLVAGMRDIDTGEILQQEQQYWLQQAVDNGWSVRQLRAAINGEKELDKDEKPTRQFLKQIDSLSSQFQKLQSNERLVAIEALRNLLLELEESTNN
ncbi:MAG: hypothetical protein AAFV93_21240 [Chloroflexota bacterium]